MEKLARLLYKFRFFSLGLIILLTIIFGSLIRVKIDNSPAAYFPVDDPDYLAYQDYCNTFEGGRLLIAVLKSGEIFSQEILGYIKEKTAEVADLSGVKRIHSLSNANRVIGTLEGIEISPLLTEIGTYNLQKIKKEALEDELFRDYLISSTGELTTMAIILEEFQTSKEMAEGIHRVKEILEKGKPENLTLFYAGDAMARYEFDRFSKQNQEVFPLLVISIVLIFMLFLFRSVYKALIILAVVGMSLCWALGFYSILGYTFNVIAGMLIPLVLILSISDSIHIMDCFDRTRDSHNKEETFIKTISYIGVPCFITSITTALALLSLSTSSIAAVRNFGIGSAAGIMFAFFVSIVFVPLSLMYVPSKQKKKEEMRFLKWLSKVNEKRTTTILIATLIGFIGFGVGISKIKTETNNLEYFPKESRFYKASMLVDKNLSGTGNMEIIIQGDEGVLIEPKILRGMDELSSKIKGLPHVKKVISLADYVKRINKALKEDAPEEYRIPKTRSLIAQELFLFTLSDDGREELEGVVTPNYSKGRISIKIESTTSEEMVKLGKTIERIAKETFDGAPVNITMTGVSYLFSLLDERLIQSQIRTFSIAILLVIGILFILFRSVKYGGLAILPNLLPIIFIMGLMGWTGITLNVGTVMVASVALGIAVDDTVHFITRFRKEFEYNRLPIQEATTRSIIFAGRSIFLTSIINIAGFLVLLLSGFQPTREFGMLVALTLFFALFGDIVVLPAMIIRVKKFLKQG